MSIFDDMEDPIDALSRLRQRAEKAEAELDENRAAKGHFQDLWIRRGEEITCFQAQAAAMRTALERVCEVLENDGEERCAIAYDTAEDALGSTDAGKGWLSPDEHFEELCKNTQAARDDMRREGYISTEQTRALVDRVVEACARVVEVTPFGSSSAPGRIRILDRAALLKGDKL